MKLPLEMLAIPGAIVCLPRATAWPASLERSGVQDGTSGDWPSSTILLLILDELTRYRFTNTIVTAPIEQTMPKK